MADSLWVRLRKIPWDQYPTSPSSPKAVPRILENLASRKLPRAMKASHDLWLALCTDDVHPAAEPSFPFLITILGISNEAVQAEILDIILKCAQLPHNESAETWQNRLRALIKKERPFITKLSQSHDEVVADKATRLLQLI